MKSDKLLLFELPFYKFKYKKIICNTYLTFSERKCKGLPRIAFSHFEFYLLLYAYKYYSFYQSLIFTPYLQFHNQELQVYFHKVVHILESG